jgi:hypothetical protein
MATAFLAEYLLIVHELYLFAHFLNLVLHLLYNPIHSWIGITIQSLIIFHVLLQLRETLDFGVRTDTHLVQTHFKSFN